MDSDLYRVLGVPRDADVLAIKGAFRRLAKRTHPDLNRDDREAEQRFAEVLQAYRVLSDPKRRSQYDQLDHATAGRGRELLRELLEGLGIRRGRPPAEHGADTVYHLPLSFRQACMGDEVRISRPTARPCEKCRGTGARELACVEICQDCDGEGLQRRETLFLERWDRCGSCLGVGYLGPHDCPACGGVGSIDVREELVIDVPAGVTDGQRLRIAGAGEPGRRGGKEGDLFVALTVSDHPLFERKGSDLLLELPIPVTEAIAGEPVTVPTLTGPVQVDLGPTDAATRMVRLSGHGVRLSDGAPGDLVVTLVVEFPSSLSDAQRCRIAEIAQRWGPGAYPRTAAFWERLSDSDGG